MKKLLFVFTLTVFSLKINAQFNATTSVQFYVDANNNCNYDLAEQLVFSTQSLLYYTSSTGTVSVIGNYGDTISSCNPFVINLWNASTVTPVSNTLIIPQGIGITRNLGCNTFNNIPYNTNAVNYLPVTLTTTSTVGAQIGSIYFGPNNLSGGYYTNSASPVNTIGVCSTIGDDVLSMYISVVNFMDCSATVSMSPRTYSLYMDGVNYDVITTTGTLASGSMGVQGINATATLTELYTSSFSSLYLNTRFPATFTTLGAHTFEIRSSMLYGNASSMLNLSQVINSVPCSKISGRFYNDCNNNCTFDGSDSYGIGNFATGKIYNTATGLNLDLYPDPTDGSFSLYVPAATVGYSLTQYPTLAGAGNNFTACVTGTTAIPAGVSTNTFLFGYQSSGANLSDPSVGIFRSASTSTIISPGVGVTFDVVVNNSWLNFCNISSPINPGRLKVTLPKFINYVSLVSGSTPTIVNGLTADTLIWAVPNFSTFSYITLCSFSAVVSATAVANTSFSINSSVSPAMDTYTLNNSFNWLRTIDGPFDPNGKITEATGLQSNGDVTFGTNQFFYTIGFQNIGKAPAINVITLDTIDASFDLSTLRVLQSSFPVSTQIDQNSRLAGFHFDGINLPGVLTDEPGSHGFVRYTIKLKPNIPVNTVLKNRAHNYFDFNEPVATNQTSNKLVVLTTALNENGNIENSVKAIPNPFKTNLKITSEKGIEKIWVFNLMGALVLETSSNATEAQLNFENLPSAVYLVKVTSLTGAISTIKIIKE